MQAVERAVERVIESINEDYSEELSVDDMARTAMYSKFHFTRIFQRVTGLTPGRFLSAVRLQKAKQLLTSTPLSVTDISHMVGYTSIGTFSSRFGYSVCVPPSTYRRLGGFRPWVSFENRRHNGHRIAVDTRSTIRGSISFPCSSGVGPIFIGLFPSRIPQGEPVRCTILRSPGSYLLEDVPHGSWYVMACSPSGDVPGTLASAPVNGHGRPHIDESMSVGYHGPIIVYPGMVQMADIRLRPMRTLDPPVLLALPDLRPEVLGATADSAA